MRRRDFIGTLLASPLAAWLGIKAEPVFAAAVGVTHNIHPGDDIDAVFRKANSGDTINFMPGRHTITSGIECGEGLPRIVARDCHFESANHDDTFTFFTFR